jgi:hypothetical protein
VRGSVKRANSQVCQKLFLKPWYNFLMEVAIKNIAKELLPEHEKHVILLFVAELLLFQTSYLVNSAL